QLQIISSPADVAAPPVQSPRAVAIAQSATQESAATDENALHHKPVQHSQAVMTSDQKKFLAKLIERYCAKTKKSKSFTQIHRRTLADPRVVSGFRPEWKEMVYSIVSSRSLGSKLWDIDGNEYVDLLNGFGPTMFGHSPDFVAKAVQDQLAEGFAIGPQTPLAGRAADLLAEMTGAERVTFCNTGSEAVMAAMRIARTVTGRDRVVFFSGDYHGQFDEVLVKQLKRKGEFSVQPAAPGIPRANLGNITVLDYGTEESLHYIEQHANELAAVLIEPVQSRHPYLQPKEFLTRVRDITRQSGTAFIFDEVVTGFRIHPRGAQGFYGIDADLMTYGKVVGGGMPIGILAGKAAFMDALDGGHWEFGDNSVPEVGMTFFAGTFVRHPLVMAALCATLEHIRSAGVEMYDTLNRRAARFATELSAVISGTSLHLEHCGSVMYLGIPSELRFGGLLHYLLREKGIFLLEGFPFYLTTAHSDADLDHVLLAFRESIAELQTCDLLPHGLESHSRLMSNPVSKASATATVTEFPLTEPQLEILLAAQVSEQANCAFNESFRLALDGPLDLNALQSAWRGLLDRHDALRMSLTPSSDSMRVHRDRDIVMQQIDFTGFAAGTERDRL
ncbi:MAG: aminotransferase class III-fold pyridoxal phosphate-dependent enzyme, partial [Acidobacteriaceae bacterium]